MPKKIKSQKAYRTDIASFEKEQTAPFFLYQLKEYNENGLPTHETEYKPNGIKVVEIIYEYDALMNMLNKQTFYPLEDTLEKLVYIYNAEGEKIIEENYFGDDLFEILEYKYNDKDHITEQTRKDDEDNEVEKQVSEFDEKGRVVRQTYFTNGEIDRIIEYRFDETGLCTGEKHTYPEKGSAETVEHSYNELGKRTLSITKDEDGNIIGYLEVEYDEKMNPTRFINETSGFHNSKTINQMEYDEEGRITENEYFDVLNNFLMSKDSYVYDENGNIGENEIFETNPMAGLKKTHYRLKMEYNFF